VETIGRQLGLTAKLLRSHLDHQLGEHGASFPNYLALTIVGRSGPMSQRQLAERMGIEPPTCNRHVDHLVELGLLARDRDRDDRRLTVIALTDDGRRRQHELGAVVGEIDAEIRELFSAEEAGYLVELLHRLHTHILEKEIRERRPA
jgi:DNA-binding MarR family transcriptional regulator